MARREFLMLAQVYDPAKHGIAMWFASEKLDGIRAWWDGGATRGKWADEVPFANVEKDGRFVQRPRATGLWSRYGKVIHAPGWWLDALPPISLDGELYAGRGNWQPLSSSVRSLEGDWGGVKFMVFDAPPHGAVLADGEVRSTHYKKEFRGLSTPHERREFFSTYSTLLKADLSYKNSVIELHRQEELPATTDAARARLDELMAEVVNGGGEGIILRRPVSVWEPQRTHSLLKVKPELDGEAVVTGYTWGRRTDLGSKLLGLMGALVLEYDRKRFELSGFTEAERVMCFSDGNGHHRARAIGEANPGCEVQGDIHNPLFPMGATVSFKYRELTDRGVPKEARYWRRRA